MYIYVYLESKKEGRAGVKSTRPKCPHFRTRKIDVKTIGKSSVSVNRIICTYCSGWADWFAHKERYHWVVRDASTGEQIIESPQDYRSQKECDLSIAIFQEDGSLPPGKPVSVGIRNRKLRPFPPAGGKL